jgi:hypothetical protein
VSDQHKYKRGNRRAFFVTSERAFSALPHWLAEKNVDSFSFNELGEIRVSRRIGSRFDWRGTIIIKAADNDLRVKLFEQTRAALREIFSRDNRHDARHAEVHDGNAFGVSSGN